MKISKAKRLQRRKLKKLLASAASAELVFAADSLQIVAGQQDKPPAINLVAYSGGKLNLPNYPHPVVIDLAGVRAMDTDQLPILRDHDQRRPLGHGQPIVEANQLKHQGVMSHAGKERDDVIQAQQQGFRWQASVGGRIPNARRDVDFFGPSKKVTVNGRMQVGPVHVVRAFLWKETSVVALGDDEDRAS